MAWTARPSVAHRIRLTMVGAVVLTALVAGPAGADAPAAAGEPRSPLPGFLLDRGRYTRFEVPAATQTVPAGIDNRGRIVGLYRDAGGATHGFLRDERGRIATIDVPGAQATEATGINDRGQVVGTASDRPFGSPDGRRRGFLLDRGRFITIHFPGAIHSEAHGLNERGQVVGEYIDGARRFHGFLWDRGRFTTLDVPGSPLTSASDLNDRGQILGVHGAPTEPVPATLHGFVRSRGRYASFDVPGVPFTQATAINNRGQIVGSSYRDILTLAGARGFLLPKGIAGPVVPVEVPGAPRTLALGLNDRGQVVGAYENPAPTTGP